MVAGGGWTNMRTMSIRFWSANNGDPIDALDERACWCKSEIQSREKKQVGDGDYSDRVSTGDGASARSSRGILAAVGRGGHVTFRDGDSNT